MNYVWFFCTDCSFSYLFFAQIAAFHTCSFTYSEGYYACIVALAERLPYIYSYLCSTYHGYIFVWAEAIILWPLTCGKGQHLHCPLDSLQHVWPVWHSCVASHLTASTCSGSLQHEMKTFTKINLQFVNTLPTNTDDTVLEPSVTDGLHHIWKIKYITCATKVNGFTFYQVFVFLLLPMIHWDSFVVTSSEKLGMSKQCLQQ